MKAKIYVVLIALVTSLSLCAQTSGTCGPNLTWTLNNGVLRVSGEGNMTSAPWLEDDVEQDVIHAIIGDSVTNICRRAFYKDKELMSISIGNRVSNIGEEAFEDCHSLKTVSLPNSVKSIEKEAFYDCYLTSINLGDSIVSIGESAFGYGDFNTITLPSSITSIGWRSRSKSVV